MRAHVTLTEAIRDVLDDFGKVPCIDHPRLYQDGDQRPSTKLERARRQRQINACRTLCSSCPVLEVCLVYAEAARAQRVDATDFLPVRELVAA